jgi:hypothetical protein
MHTGITSLQHVECFFHLRELRAIATSYLRKSREKPQNSMATRPVSRDLFWANQPLAAIARRSSLVIERVQGRNPFHSSMPVPTSYYVFQVRSSLPKFTPSCKLSRVRPRLCGKYVTPPMEVYRYPCPLSRHAPTGHHEYLRELGRPTPAASHQSNHQVPDIGLRIKYIINTSWAKL